MIGGVTRHMLPHLSGVHHLNENKPYEPAIGSVAAGSTTSRRLFGSQQESFLF